MTTEALIELISDHLQEVNDDGQEREKRIKDMLDFLNWNLKITQLTPGQKAAFAEAMEPNLSDVDRNKLNKLDTDTKKDKYINSIARANYFRKCAWVNYLSGEGEMPYVEEAKNKSGK